MQAKPNKVKVEKRAKRWAVDDGGRKRREQVERRKQERKREIEKRQRRKAFDTWVMYIREGVREV